MASYEKVLRGFGSMASFVQVGDLTGTTLLLLEFRSRAAGTALSILRREIVLFSTR